MYLHVHTLNTNWKYCQVEIQNVFIRSKTIILWKCHEIKIQLNIVITRDSNIKLKFSIGTLTKRRINHSREISHILTSDNVGIIIKCCWFFNHSKCLIAKIHVHLPRVLSYDVFTLHANYKGTY